MSSRGTMLGRSWNRWNRWDSPGAGRWWEPSVQDYLKIHREDQEFSTLPCGNTLKNVFRMDIPESFWIISAG